MDKRTEETHSFFFYGAAKNNPGKEGAGGVILYPNGKK